MCVPGSAFAQKCVGPSFAAPALTFVDPAPGDIVAADFNNDGLPDVAVGDAGQVQVFLGTGGGFTPSATILAAGAYAVAVGDINKDGNVDIAIAADTSTSLFIALGNGGGGFGAPAPIFVGPTVPRAIELVDVNHDGNLDIIYGDAAVPGLSGIMPAA